MGAIDLLKLEFRKLLDNKALLFTLLGILLIPIIYVAVLLSSKWGPYDNMDNLPVAFVNNDAGAISGGSPINVGIDLEETLKASPSLGWNFVTSEEAAKGLESNDYYMVIEVPEDFSQKVTTVLDATPQVPEIHYTKNEGMNFMAAQVTNSAVERIREQLGDKITATFATTVFEKFPNIADGFLSGTDGAKQIKNGTIQLADGTNTMLASLQQKAPDIARLADGAKQADIGATTLLSSVTNGTGDINLLANGANQVADGAKRLATGAASLKGGTSQVADGADRLAAGTQSLKGGTSQVADGADRLAAGAASLKGGTSQVAAGADRLAQGTTEVSNGAHALATGATDLKDGASRVLTGLQDSETGSQQVLTGLGDVKSGVTVVNSRLTELEAGATQVHGGLAQLSTEVSGLAAQLQPLAATNPELGQKVQQLVESLQQLTGGAEQLKTGASQLVAGTSSQGQLASGVDQLIAGQTRLNAGLTELIGGQTSIVGGTEQLVAGSNRLATGATDLNTGAATLVAGVGQLGTGAGELNAGATALKAGIGQVDAGATDLQTGVSALKAGIGQVDAGAGELNAGATTLAAGAGQVADGNQKLTVSWRGLTDGVKQLKAGTAQIADGNRAVATGWSTLIDGTTQLNAGAIQLRDGSEQLATGLEGGYAQVAAVNAGQDNISMFASPVTLVGEEVNAYSYYRDSTAPYVLSLALFVSLLVLSFFIDFKKPASNPSSAFSWYVSKWLKLATFAVAQALVLSLFVLIVLGLDVTNVLFFILFTIFVSLTFMSIIFFLVAVGGNIGRFIGLAFIVLQLSITGSNLPIDMLPANLRTVSQFLPLTYSNAGFKSTISLGDLGFLYSNALVLAIYFVVASVLALLVFLVSFKSIGSASKSDSMMSES
ncbi:MAG: YhgE/Pip domain-containing protein [Solibacillus sp.]